MVQFYRGYEVAYLPQSLKGGLIRYLDLEATFSQPLV